MARKVQDGSICQPQTRQLTSSNGASGLTTSAGILEKRDLSDMMVPLGVWL